MSLPGRRELLIVTALGALFLGASALGAAPPAGATVVGAGSVGVEAPNDPMLEPATLEELVGPVALYPDDLLALVLRAATNPLQVVQAARFLSALEDDPDLEPDPGWDPAVVALLNYPEALHRLDADLDWTRALGRAVVHQEPALLDAVDRFRRQSRAAGNLVSDHRQRVEVENDALTIRPADPAVLYVPRYEPRLARVRHRTPVVRYYPRPCPVYYYPYPAGHFLTTRHFWGLSSVYRIGWDNRELRFLMLEHRSHPYHGAVYRWRDHRYWEPRLHYRDYWGERRLRDDHRDVYERHRIFRRYDGAGARLDRARDRRLITPPRETRHDAPRAAERRAPLVLDRPSPTDRMRGRSVERASTRAPMTSPTRPRADAAERRAAVERATPRPHRGAQERPGRARVHPQ